MCPRHELKEQQKYTAPRKTTPQPPPPPLPSAHLEVLGGHGVARAVRVGEGVEERLQGPLEKIDERLLHGELAAAAEDGVLEDVGHARAVLRRGAERHAEHLTAIKSIHAVVCFEKRRGRGRLHVRKKIKGGGHTLGIEVGGCGGAVVSPPFTFP